MALTISKVDLWTAEMADHPGALAEKLAGLAGAGVDLEFLIARRQPDRPGTGIAFASGISGAKAAKAAAQAGFSKNAQLGGLRAEGPNKAGAVHQIVRKIADAGINLRGVSAATVGRRFVAFLAFDSPADATRAARLLKGGT
jgi:hypothetical protein